MLKSLASSGAMTTDHEGSVVLVVDDHANTRHGVRSCLDAEGFSIAEASNGKEAIDWLVSSGVAEPDLILLDANMPIMDGWELLAIVKSYHRLSGIPVVIMSATEPHPDVVSRGAIAGFLAKPIDAAALVATVRKCIRSRP
jgi:CheY-like chemotaxis protein